MFYSEVHEKRHIIKEIGSCSTLNRIRCLYSINCDKHVPVIDTTFFRELTPRPRRKTLDSLKWERLIYIILKRISDQKAVGWERRKTVRNTFNDLANYSYVNKFLYDIKWCFETKRNERRRTLEEIFKKQLTNDAAPADELPQFKMIQAICIIHFACARVKLLIEHGKQETTRFLL